MSLHLADYRAVLADLGQDAEVLLQSLWQEAVKVFSNNGLQNYLQAAQSLKSLGRGSSLVLAYLASAPAVAKELGEGAAQDLFSTAIKMYAKTSVGVLELLFSTAPIAAARLGEAELFKSYLGLLDYLLTQIPRALRPMLEKIEVLLTHLTLGGLRRWALWGASAYKNDFNAQGLYFSLASEESQAIMKREQRGTLFVQVQRRLIMYLRALWGRDFLLRPTSGDFENRQGYRPFLEDFFIYLPDAFDDYAPEGQPPVSGLSIYRAAAAHAAAHAVYSQPFPELAEASALSKLCLGLLEDARVERLAIQAFPGLKPLWSSLLITPELKNQKITKPWEVVNLLEQASAALLDFSHLNEELPDFLKKIISDFHQNSDWSSRDFVQKHGEALAKQLAAFSWQKRDFAPLYRDDNRHLWQLPDVEKFAEKLHLPKAAQRKYVSLMEMINALDVEYAGDDAQEIWVLPTEFYEDDGTTLNAKEGKAPVSAPVTYPEWDYLTQLERPDWVTLFEKRPKNGDPESIDKIIQVHKPLVNRLKRLMEALQPQGVQRIRKVEDGDDIDLNAAIRALVDIRMGQQPDPRIGVRTRLHVRDLSVILLIDLSQSTNDPILGAEQNTTVLALAQEAAALLAESLAKIGDSFAIHGFASNGRHEVEYYRLKDFDEPYKTAAKARLAGITGQLSTRMGAALRHAGVKLQQRGSARKLILLLTDGEPADNDVRDPQYLRLDSKRAVEELKRQGISTYCVSLDPRADQYVSRIFGAKNYLVLDSVSRLPEKLPALYLSLTR
jgi:uncharacterized protein YegL